MKGEGFNPDGRPTGSAQGHLKCGQGGGGGHVIPDPLSVLGVVVTKDLQLARVDLGRL